ncbi:Deoxyribonuclease-2-alpha [Bagarius yarrelli]|uniref:Deoxyribonuclease-2-alpha n=1 Tax=Bagarius yarrelli TaxID=175774 RepID=A0A556TLQ4_BAGYA|nr:Deoxyribonuclease-2-alpha [Bagarius yarrelli]
MFMIVFIPLFLLRPAGGTNAKLSCMDDQGNAVDWLQPPEEGLKYLLLKEESEGWTEGTVLVGDVTGALGRSLGEQLKINQPHIYDCDIPESLASSVPSMVELCKHRHGRKNSTAADTWFSSTNRSVALHSLAGNQFISFAKGAAFQNDLYHAWVAPALQTDLLVQFWRRSTGVLSSDCSSSWKVLDVQQLSPGGRVTFKTMEDHSKWAVSVGGGGSRGGAWVCVGDINRNKAEEKRGGGTVCRQDVGVWKAYRAAALECESCSGKVEECESAWIYN